MWQTTKTAVKHPLAKSNKREYTLANSYLIQNWYSTITGKYIKKHKKKFKNKNIFCTTRKYEIQM